MSEATKASWKEEWQYRYDERAAILTDGSPASGEVQHVAEQEAGEAIKKLRWVAAKRRLTDLWCLYYEKAHGFKYMFQGAKDGTAADRILRLGVGVQELINVAVEAWKHPDWFNCRQAASLAGFVCRFNEIREELKNPPVQNGARLMLFRDEYNRILARMKVLKETYSGMQTWDEVDKAEFIRLRTRRDELRKILGMVV